MTPMSDYEKALSALEGLTAKGAELCHRATMTKGDANRGPEGSVEFFSMMTLETVKAVAFWAEQLEKHHAALLAGPQKAADNG